MWDWELFYILKSLGSAGGLDILSVVFYKKFSVRPGTITSVFNAILMGTAAFRIPLEMILYTLIYLYVTSHFYNLVLVGLSQRKSIMIISPRWREISREIMDHLHRGVTVVRGEGGYTGQELHILYSSDNIYGARAVQGDYPQDRPGSICRRSGNIGSHGQTYRQSTALVVCLLSLLNLVEQRMGI